MAWHLVAGLIGRKALGATVQEVGTHTVSGLFNGPGSVGLRHKGRRIRRLLKRTDADTLRASMRATNRTGRWGRTQILRELAKLLNVKKSDLQFSEYRANPNQPRAFYRLTVFRREYPVSKLKGTRFTPDKKRPGVGTLRFTAYGKRQVLRWVLVRAGRYYLLRARGAGGKAIRRVMGAWVNANYRPSLKVKAELPGRWIAEFDRQMKLATRRRRRR